MEETLPDKLSVLRDEMRIEHLDAFIFTTSDGHGSRRIARHWNDVQWLSGYDIDGLTLILTASKAMLCPENEAMRETLRPLITDDFQLLPPATAIIDWLGLELEPINGAIVGIDGRTTPIATALTLEKGLRQHGGINLRWNFNPTDRLWSDRDPLPAPLLSPMSTDTTLTERIKMVKQALREQHCDGMLVTSLLDIALILGVHPTKQDGRPAFEAYMIIAPEQSTLYINKVEDLQCQMSILPSTEVDMKALSQWKEGAADYFAYNILIDPATCPIVLPPYLPERTKQVLATSPIEATLKSLYPNPIL